MTRLGIVADTHDNLNRIRAAVELFESEKCLKVVHCGDIVSPFAAELFDSPEFEFHYVRGNNEGEWKVKETVESFGAFHGEVGELEFAGLNFAFYHGTEEKLVEMLVDSGRYDYVLRGHTHEKGVEARGGTVELNPGGIALPGQDEGFRAAVLDAASEDVEFHRPGS